MSAIEIILTVLQLLSGLAVTLIVLMQSGKSSGLSGVIAGGAETFMSKGKAKSLDAKLAKMTKWFALAFVVLTLVLNLMARSGVGQETAVAEEPAAVTETAETETEAEPAA
jgi:preprotein translocase subunit SecG